MNVKAFQYHLIEISVNKKEPQLNINKPVSSQPANVSKHTPLVREYNALKQTFENLLAEGRKNQKIQEKFFNLELACLQATSFTTLVNRILHDLPSQLNLCHIELRLLDQTGDIQALIKEIYGGVSFENLYYCSDENSVCQSWLSNRQVRLSQSKQVLERLFQKPGHGAQSAAILPLLREQKVVGSLHLGSEDPTRFNASLDTLFLQHLASILSVCFENAITQERFKHLSLVDLLTRVKNRRYFMQAMAKEIARSTRSGEPLSCLFIDLDKFKHINDSRGHLTGDKALIEVARAIEPCLRASDVLARFGGEEFTVLLPETGLEKAKQIAERIRLQVAQLHLRDDKGHYFGVTVSIGVSAFTPNPDEFVAPAKIQETLVSQADKGVYLAKESGRNCVKVA